MSRCSLRCVLLTLGLLLTTLPMEPARAELRLGRLPLAPPPGSPVTSGTLWNPHFTLTAVGDGRLYGPGLSGQLGSEGIPVHFLWGIDVLPMDQLVEDSTLFGGTLAGNLGIAVVPLDLRPEASWIRRWATSIYARGLFGASVLRDHPVEDDYETLTGAGAGVEAGINTNVRLSPVDAMDLDLQLFGGPLFDLAGYESADLDHDLKTRRTYFRGGVSAKLRWGEEPTPFLVSGSLVLDEDMELAAWSTTLGLAFEDFPDLSPPPSMGEYYTSTVGQYLTSVVSFFSIPLLYYSMVEKNATGAMVGLFGPAVSYWIFSGRRSRDRDTRISVSAGFLSASKALTRSATSQGLTVPVELGLLLGGRWRARLASSFILGGNELTELEKADDDIQGDLRLGIRAGVALGTEMALGGIKNSSMGYDLIGGYDLEPAQCAVKEWDGQNWECIRDSPAGGSWFIGARLSLRYFNAGWLTAGLTYSQFYGPQVQFALFGLDHVF